VDQYEYIQIAYRVYGKKIREIARETGHLKKHSKKNIDNEYTLCDYRQHTAYRLFTYENIRSS